MILWLMLLLLVLLLSLATGYTADVVNTAAGAIDEEVAHVLSTTKIIVPRITTTTNTIIRIITISEIPLSSA